MNRKFRPGGVGAMMDEYERAMKDLSDLVATIEEPEFSKIIDPDTQDENGRSIQAVLHHVVRAGYGYATAIRNATGDPSERPNPPAPTPGDIQNHMREMMAFTEATLEDKWTLTDPEIMKITVDAPWGVTYDMEQLLEHAIVHVLRHRRQIEKLRAVAG